MNTNVILLKNNYWDRLFESFENYCYNYFDESYESEPQYWEFIQAFNRIPLFIAFVITFHFQLLSVKCVFASEYNMDENKTILLENTVQESQTQVVENSHSTTENLEQQIDPLLIKRTIFKRLPRFTQVKRKIGNIYKLNCVFLN